MADYLPLFMDGDQVPFTVGTGGCTGGQLLNVSGIVSGLGDTVAGVAGFDQVQGGSVTIFREGIHRLTAGATITLGQPLKAGAAGTVVPWVSGTDAANLYIADAWSAAANGATVTTALRIS